MVIKVAHVTTAHARGEVRVFLKECLSLAAADYEVHLIVADGLGEDIVRGVHIHDAGIARGRLQRMLLLPWRMWRTARKVGAKLYHLHEPELLLIALLLRGSGARVIYDSHEDVPRAILSRSWIRPWLRRFVSGTFERFENFVAARISAVVGATPHITKRFAAVNSEAVAINNYPLESEIESVVVPCGDDRTVCYVGGISKIRGILEMIRALELLDVRLILAGPFDRPATEQEARALPGWQKVDYRGMVSRVEVRRIMSQSRAGLLFFHPEPNHIDAQPNKMFEYMSAGLPVLASNFPLWRPLLVDAGAGLCADPLDPASIASAIKSLLDDPQRASLMGARGREAVLTRYQWAFEEKKLTDLYARLLA